MIRVPGFRIYLHALILLFTVWALSELGIHWFREKSSRVETLTLFYYDAIEGQLVPEITREPFLKKSQYPSLDNARTLMDRYTRGPESPLLKNVFFHKVQVNQIFFIPKQKAVEMLIDLDRRVLLQFDRRQEEILINGMVLTFRANRHLLSDSSFKIDRLQFTFGGKSRDRVKGAFSYSENFSLNDFEPTMKVKP